MKTNHWLNWKLKHGLAARGRPAPLRPTSVIGHIFFFCYFRFKEVPAPVETHATRLTFKQRVGGSLGPVGKMNGE